MADTSWKETCLQFLEMLSGAFARMIASKPHFVMSSRIHGLEYRIEREDNERVGQGWNNGKPSDEGNVVCDVGQLQAAPQVY